MESRTNNGRVKVHKWPINQFVSKPSSSSTTIHDGGETRPSALPTPEPEPAIMSSAPISNLPHDLLLKIFQINADMEKDCPLKKNELITRNTPRAINFTLNSSQVSFLWRDLIINAPVLWANLMDLEALDIAGKLLRGEVLCRIQGATLYVKGEINLGRSFDATREPWWLTFFNDKWPRIRVFDVVLVNGPTRINLDLLEDRGLLDSYQRARYQKALPFLSRGSANLESFRLELPHPCDPMNAKTTLFNGYAPQLHFFQVHNWPKCLTSHQHIQWLPQLQNLNILQYSGKMFAFVDQFYQLVVQIPGLRSLYLTNPIATSFIAAHRVPIHFPLLERIEIRSTTLMLGPSTTPTLCWNVLGFIIPRLGCSIRVLTTYDCTSDSLLQAATVLTRYARNFFEIYPPTDLALASSPGHFRLTYRDFEPYNPKLMYKDKPLDEMPFLDFNIKFTLPAMSRGDKLRDLFEGVFYLTFPSVTDLDLDIDLSHRDAFSDQQFGNLISSFSSVEEMTTTVPTLYCLNTSSVVDATKVFPRLQILNMKKQTKGTGFDAMPHFLPREDILMKFVNSRHRAAFAASKTKLRRLGYDGPNIPRGRSFGNEVRKN